jgi:hypothetical protein
MPTLICPGMAKLVEKPDGWYWEIQLSMGKELVEYPIHKLPGLWNEPNPMPFATRDDAIVYWQLVVEPVLVLTDIF